MSNMSYCRFINTLRDLQDCLQSLREDGVKEMSEEEAQAASLLAGVCTEFTDEFLEQTDSDDLDSPTDAQDLSGWKN